MDHHSLSSLLRKINSNSSKTFNSIRQIRIINSKLQLSQETIIITELLNRQISLKGQHHSQTMVQTQAHYSNKITDHHSLPSRNHNSHKEITGRQLQPNHHNSSNS